MYLPHVSAAGGKTRRQVVKFGGLDRGREGREGELADSLGLSARDWPCLGQRRGRRAVRKTDGASALYAWDKLVTVEGTSLRYDGQVVGTVEEGPKRFAVVGSQLCIFPDKKYLDLTTRALGDLQATVVNPQGLEAVFTERSVTLRADDLLGQVRSGAPFLQPKEATVRSYRVKRDTGYSYYLQVFDELEWDSGAGRWRQSIADAREIWTPHATQQNLVGKKVWLRDTGISGGYALNLRKVAEDAYIDGENRFVIDRPTLEPYGAYQTEGLYGIITGVSETDLSRDYDYDYTAKTILFRLELHNAAKGNPSLEGLFAPGDRVSVSGCTLREENNREKLAVEAVEGMTVTFALGEGEGFVPAAETGGVTLCREVPELDFVCAAQGRLMGVNSAENRVYISALGRPGNFYVHDGLASDSAALDAGTDGAFTGCAAYGGGAVFFKEDCLIKLMGARASAYELYAYQVPGLQAGSEGSLAVLGEALYYKSRDGVYAYAGATPRLISAGLGETGYTSAAAGSDGRRYYLSMRATDGTWELLTYDTRTGLWLKEEERQASHFAALDGTVYMLSQGTIYALDQGEDDGGAPIDWMALFVPFDETTHRRKRPSRLLLRLELEPGAWARAELAQDDGPFRTVWAGHDSAAPTAVIPLRPGRCDSYRLRLTGQGRCLVKSLEREFSLGGLR